MVKFDELKNFLTFHHIANSLLALSFMVSKSVPLISEQLYSLDNQSLDTREHEILIFLAVVILWRGRKATNYLHYLETVFTFTKTANSFLFIRADPLYGIMFVTAMLIVTFVFPMPVYAESDKVTYFHGEDLYKKIKENTNTVWIVQFYTTWSPECRHLTPVFSKLSERFSLPNMKFAKIDLGMYPKEAERFRVNPGATSKQLPTISVFKGGADINRRPLVHNKRAVPYVFSEENCILDLDLINIHNECQGKNVVKKGKSKSD
uniref:Thioredoxin domain-containing protein n=1 Tax=Rhabditophanes sp. KR3021 TaxID=114890 RepID=A0AC35TI00_9BILA